ncbi:hypothetical protein [Acrocarpospora pleiomorpha]|uniref:hypothetical protein n=1 Tax=Acrocarpospora pleiomorpha TaxID=90975 RepID=UPI0012D36753|nr:hypothetical protein [Acrocarpospora pleiomorpha]
MNTASPPPGIEAGHCARCRCAAERGASGAWWHLRPPSAACASPLAVQPLAIFVPGPADPFGRN